MNIVAIAGNLGNTPELRQTQNNRDVCNLRVPTNRRWVDKSGELKEATDWINVTVWDKQARACANNLTVGRWVNVEARLRERERQVGDETIRVLEVVANRVQFGPRPNNTRSETMNLNTGPVADTNTIPE